MSTQLIAIMVVLGLALFVLFVGWGALAVSGREEEEQQRWMATMAAVGSRSDGSDGSDYSDGSEHDDG